MRVWMAVAARGHGWHDGPQMRASVDVDSGKQDGMWPSVAEEKRTAIRRQSAACCLLLTLLSASRQQYRQVGRLRLTFWMILLLPLLLLVHLMLLPPHA